MKQFHEAIKNIGHLTNNGRRWVRPISV